MMSEDYIEEDIIYNQKDMNKNTKKIRTSNYDYISLFLVLFGLILIVIGFWEIETILWNRIKYSTGSQWSNANPYYLTTPLSKIESLLTINLLYYSIGNFLVILSASIMIYQYIIRKKWFKTSKIYLLFLGVTSILASLLGFWLNYSFDVIEEIKPLLGETKSGYDWIRGEIPRYSVIIELISQTFWISSLIISLMTIYVVLKKWRQYRRKPRELSITSLGDRIQMFFFFFGFSLFLLLLFLFIIFISSPISYLLFYALLGSSAVFLFLLNMSLRNKVIPVIRNFMKNLPFYLILLAYLSFTLFPVYLALRASFSTVAEINTGQMPNDPLRSMILNYSSVLFTLQRTAPSFRTALFNSLFLGFGTSLVSLALSVTSAYALARLKFKGKSFLSYIVLSTQMFPAIVLLIPQYVILSDLGLIEDRVVLYGTLLVMSTGATAYVTWMMKGYFETIPRDIEEAAYIDGYGKFRTFIKIVLPLAKSGMVAVMVFTFLSAWQEFILARTFIGQSDAQHATLPLLFYQYQRLDAPDIPTFFELLSPYAVLVAAPVVLFYLFLQRQLVGGVLAGAVK